MAAMVSGHPRSVQDGRPLTQTEFDELLGDLPSDDEG